MGPECDSHYMPPQLADGFHFGNPNLARFGIMPGEQSLNLPMPSLPPDVAAAIGAAITGNWRGLLHSALAPLERDLWSRALNPPGITNPVSTQLSSYDQCVESSPWNEYDPEKLEIPEAPEGHNAGMGVSPAEGTIAVPSNNDLYLSTMKNCLKQYSLAGMAPGYQGLGPGLVF